MNKILYFTCWYNESNDARRAELLEALNRTLFCSNIDKVILLCENCKPPFTHEKLVSIALDERPTYSLFFKIMNDIGDFEDIVVMGNTDIYPSNDISKLQQLGRDQAFAFSRWDLESTSNEARLFNRKDSQDVWAFRHPIKINKDADFGLGIPGCDNRIAKVISEHGYELVNPSKSIRFFHLHETGVRNYKVGKDRVTGDYALADPVYLKEENLYKSILHVGFDQPPLERAFASVSEQYDFIRWTDYQKKPEQLRELILTKCREESYSLVFFHVQTPHIIIPETIHQIRALSKNNPLIVNWTGDVRKPLPSWYIELGRTLDISLFSNEVDMMVARSNGINAEYLQIGFDTEFFSPGKAEKKWPEIVFLGNHYADMFPLSDMRYKMVVYLKQLYGDRFGVYGSGWKHLGTENLMNDLQAEADCYRGCKVAINLSHFDYERYTSDRMFRLMGSGAFCLSHNYRKIDKDFIPGKHLVTWRDFMQLRQQIDYYLKNEQLRETIAEAGSSLVHAQHTWNYRLKEMKRILLNM